MKRSLTRVSESPIVVNTRTLHACVRSGRHHRIGFHRDPVGVIELSKRAYPLLAAFAAGSGLAALIYQVVWFQLLSLAIGASAVSLGVLLFAFMGGSCLGSLLFAKIVAAAWHPLRVYAAIELGIGVIGLVLLYGIPAIANVYVGWTGAGLSGTIGRAAIAAVFLLPPTILMGASFPALARWLETSPRGVARLGFLYAANIGGAVAGSLLAGFYLLRVYDVAVATSTAAAVNAAVAGGSLCLAAGARYVPGAGRPRTSSRASRPIYVVIALSGMTALAAEVLWTRQLSLIMGATVYAFALILAVFLLGLGIGSGGGAALSRAMPARTALGLCQLLLCPAMVWAAFAITRSLPYWPIDVTLAASPWMNLQLDLLRVMWAILPAALLWGASFPLALAAAAQRGQDPARLAGGLYAANTVGAVAGSLATAFVLVAWLGSQVTQQALILVSAAAGVFMLAPSGWTRGFRAARAVALAGTAAGAVALALAVPGIRGEVVAYGRFTPTRGVGANVIYMGEGLTASVAVSEENGILTYHNAGKAQASTYPQDMRLQRMLGHLTTLVPDERNSFLVIGLGTGITAGAVAIEPAARRIVIAEIEPLVARNVPEYFREPNFGVLDNPKVEIVIEDGRHYLATTSETFDGITSDPLDPWVKGAAALYTREFWELVRSRLNPGGAVTVFVQLYESTEEAVKSEVATFFEVFPNGAVFANTQLGEGYDAVLLGRAGGEPIDVDRMRARLRSPEYASVARSLREVGVRSAVDLLGTFAGQASNLDHWLEGAAINRDRNLRLQYLAGEGLNRYDADVIFDNMLADGLEFPDTLFTGSPDVLEQVRQNILTRRR